MRAYYETLYEKLESRKQFCIARIEELMRRELAQLLPTDRSEVKFAAYCEACLAFLEERIETYNPVGAQYLFDQADDKTAFKLELELNWYDSRQEFARLVEAARQLAQADMAEKKMQESVATLIKQCGAYPDKSIIAAYQAEPLLSKLPDYVLSLVIEELLREIGGRHTYFLKES